jgi:hypothetical protein
MLTVDDDDFWAGIEPLDISGLPAMQVWLVCCDLAGRGGA